MAGRTKGSASSGVSPSVAIAEPSGSERQDVIRSLVLKLKRQRAQMRSMGYFPLATALSGVVRQAEELLATLESDHPPRVDEAESG